MNIRDKGLKDLSVSGTESDVKQKLSKASAIAESTT